MITYKFWVDRGEQLSEQDLVSGFDFECEAKDRFEAQQLFLESWDHKLARWDLGEGVTVFYLSNGITWFKITVRQPPTIYTVQASNIISVKEVYKHFEVGK